MSSQAGPSTSKIKTYKRKSAPELPTILSEETIDSNLDHDDDDDDEKESEDDADNSPDSEGDIEGVIPRRKPNGVSESTSKPAAGRSLP